METFDQFWLLYPKKVARKDALKAWNSLTDAEHVSALAALPDHIRYWLAHNTDQHHMPHCGTWIRGERWMDDLVFERRKTPRPETAQEHRAHNVATLTGRRHEPDADGAIISLVPSDVRKQG